MPEYIPLRTDGSKAPAVSGWQKPDYHCTLDEALAVSDWVGMRADGLVIMDLDTAEAIDFWEQHTGSLDGFQHAVRTPHGLHVYYQWAPGSPEGPMVNVFQGKPAGIDIRAGAGSYVVAPPTPGYTDVSGEQ